MNPKHRLLYLIGIMILVASLGGGFTFYQLYKTAIDEQRGWLENTAKSQARLIEAVARFDTQHIETYNLEDPATAALSQITDAHQRYEGFGETGEFTLARRVEDTIFFLLSHRHKDMDNPEPVPFHSNLAEPMKRALTGKSGTMIGNDYRGVLVLAAYEPVAILNLGIVAKMDIREIRKPFVLSGIYASIVAIILITIGAYCFIRITNPLIDHLEETNKKLELEVDERKKAERELKNMNILLTNILNSTPDMIFAKDMELRTLLCNNAYAKAVGKTPNEMIGKTDIENGWNPELVLGNQKKGIRGFENDDRQALSGNKVHNPSDPANVSGEIRVFDTQKVPLYDNKQIFGMLGIARDVTEQKKAEAQIKSSLKEKEVLLKEIHHRVKNNMQVISSLLNLQSKNIKDKQLIDIFKESQNRVKSMALIHEELYQSKDLASINIANYIRRLTTSLIRTYLINPNSILLNIDIDNLFLSVDTAIPCGLIINELFSNSLKYAFPAIMANTEYKPEDSTKREQGESKGEICIRFSSDNNKYTLVYSDNGVGLPEDLDFKNPKTLGLELVNTLTDQIDGTIELDRSKGTEFRIVFKV